MDLPTPPAHARELRYRFLGGSSASAQPGQVDWAIGLLEERLGKLSVRLSTEDAPEAPAQAPLAGEPSGGARVIFALGRGAEVERAARLAAVDLPEAPESFAIFGDTERTEDLCVYGADTRGLVYAITELADRADCAGSVPDAADYRPALVEKPATAVRSISRCFQSEVEDLAWFHDREGWEAYLTLLATHRFNRLSLTLGMQYNYPYGNEFLSDVYLYFAYPFLVEVPGHDVRVSNLAADERARNLETLKFIAREAARRGLEFQLALWTQSYDFDDCPGANHRISGLGPDNIAAYCRDALAMLLAEVPEISGLTLRVHVECGIPEGRYDFWQTYFEAVTGAGRRIRLDLHAKGIDDRLIEIALATGMAVTISPKYTSEHLGLPYHQASIRALELPQNHQVVFYSGDDVEKHAGKWQFSEGSRRFMRYSYGDLLREGRPYDIVYRIWPGTVRLLLWGDPLLAGGYGRNASFCGSQGIELCEPLSFKGRMGSGVSGNRIGYRDGRLAGDRDWEKFAYTYRVWGRSLYDPEADPRAFRRYLEREFGEIAGPCERALSYASRILPLITLAHTPTASNNSYWPEIYENMSVVHEAPPLPYGYEQPGPSRFGTVGACDPQLFLSPREFATCLHRGQPVRRLTPLTWANWLARLAAAAELELARADAGTRQATPGYLRLSVDVAILAGIGRFFAEKVRAAVLWELHLLSGEARAAEAALAHYGLARDAWAAAAEAGRQLYVEDLAYGPHSWLRGRWDDRLPAIEQDIAEMAGLVAQGRSAPRRDSPLGARLVAAVEAWSSAQRQACRHRPPDGFLPGEDLEISCLPAGASRRAVVLHYRHVDQSKPWRAAEMAWDGTAYRGRIPGDYTRAPFPLQYYFEISDGTCSHFCPGLEDDLCNVPYFVLESVNSCRKKVNNGPTFNEEKLP